MGPGSNSFCRASQRSIPVHHERAPKLRSDRLRRSGPLPHRCWSRLDTPPIATVAEGRNSEIAPARSGKRSPARRPAFRRSMAGTARPARIGHLMRLYNRSGRPPLLVS
jgi:hypothetical protein